MKNCLFAQVNYKGGNLLYGGIVRFLEFVRTGLIDKSVPVRIVFVAQDFAGSHIDYALYPLELLGIIGIAGPRAQIDVPGVMARSITSVFSSVREWTPLMYLRGERMRLKF